MNGVAELQVNTLVVSPRAGRDPRAAGLLHDAHALGLRHLASIECHDLYFISGRLSEAEQERLATELLSEPVTQTAVWRCRSAAPVGATGNIGGLAAPARAGLPTPLRSGGLRKAARYEQRPLNRAFRSRLSAGVAPSPELQLRAVWAIQGAPVKRGRQTAAVIEVALRAGVTDPVAEQVVRAAHELGLAGVERALTGQRYVVTGKLASAELHILARRLLANPVIQHYALGEIEPAFPEAAAASGQVDTIPLRALAADALLSLSLDRRAALDLPEMVAIQEYYRAAGRDPTDVEFETLAQTWSEHCVHKTFRARIEVHGPGDEPVAVADGLLSTFLKAATHKIGAAWVRSAFADNAGIIDFDDEHEVSFKVETHNHPSAIEPFGGANTGLGGVIRDVLGVSARPIAGTDVLCFGPQALLAGDLPEGVLHPRRVRSGVVAGIQDYGNKLGLPTVNGAILYDAGYIANPLVFCGCVGIAPKGKHPRSPQPGDRVVVLGGRTGRDGLRGATFSSMTMDGQTGEVAGASVQIGDPVTEKGLLEVITRARDLALYHAITDCGAGGLASAVGEMASDLGAEIGADVELEHVRLKYPGLVPWEIWLSEAQERMVLAVPPAAIDRLKSLAGTFDVEVTDIGAFTNTGRLLVRYRGLVALDLANSFLHGGRPQRELTARLPQPRPAGPTQPMRLAASYESLLLQLLAHPNIASKADVIRLYDHEVLGGTVVKPLTGAQDDGPSDACVLKPLGTSGMRGLVISNGINPEFGKADPYRMALSVVDEAIRNAVASGADPDRIALLDNFCWGDPKRADTLGTLVAAVRGCRDAAIHHGAPFISGKDSLNNEYLAANGAAGSARQAIPPTLLISAIGLIEDVRRAVTMDFKQAGDAVYVLGHTRPEFGGSHLALVAGQADVGPARASFAASPVPALSDEAPAVYRALHRAMRAGLVRACHDLSEGGLAVAAAEMCLAGRAGAALTLDTADPLAALFSESNGRFLIEVPPANQADFETAMAGLPCRLIGQVTDGPRLSISTRNSALISLPVADLVRAWNT